MITTAHRPDYRINTFTDDIDAECYWCKSYEMAGITQALIKAFLSIRDNYRDVEHWENADKIRTFLESLGVEVKDKRKTNDEKP